MYECSELKQSRADAFHWHTEFNKSKERNDELEKEIAKLNEPTPSIDSADLLPQFAAEGSNAHISALQNRISELEKQLATNKPDSVLHTEIEFLKSELEMSDKKNKSFGLREKQMTDKIIELEKQLAAVKEKQPNTSPLQKCYDQIGKYTECRGVFQAVEEYADELEKQLAAENLAAVNAVAELRTAESKILDLQSQLALLQAANDKKFAWYDEQATKHDAEKMCLEKQLAVAKDVGEKTFNALKECENELADAKETGDCGESAIHRKIESVLREEILRLQKHAADLQKANSQWAERLESDTRELREQLAAAEYDAETVRLIEEHKIIITYCEHNACNRWGAWTYKNSWNYAKTLGEAVLAAAKGAEG